MRNSESAEFGSWHGEFSLFPFLLSKWIGWGRGRSQPLIIYKTHKQHPGGSAPRVAVNAPGQLGGPVAPGSRRSRRGCRRVLKLQGGCFFLHLTQTSFPLGTSFLQAKSNPAKPSLLYLLFSTGSVVAINGSLVQGNKVPLARVRPPRAALSNCGRTLGTALDGSSLLAGLLIAVTPERGYNDEGNPFGQGWKRACHLPPCARRLAGRSGRTLTCRVGGAVCAGLGPGCSARLLEVVRAAEAVANCWGNGLSR